MLSTRRQAKWENRSSVYVDNEESIMPTLKSYYSAFAFKKIIQENESRENTPDNFLAVLNRAVKYRASRSPRNAHSL